MNLRIGQGYDVHVLTEDRPLILGGVNIPHSKGLTGHSDADVLIHAICDALLGALALGDIGDHFPDSDEKFKNIDSRILLRDCLSLVEKNNYSIENIDSTVVAQQPKISPYIGKIRKNIANDLKIELRAISVKATTSEKLGFEGREEGISALAITLLAKN